jgi:protein-tyrosine-phosphatase
MKDRLNDLRRLAGQVMRSSGRARWILLRRALETRSARRRRLDAALAAGVDRLVFVRHGNIMRSDFAVAYARQLAPKWSDSVVGAGTHATAGRPAHDDAVAAAALLGVSLEGHRAQPLAALALGERDLVVCMDRVNDAHTVERRHAAGHRVFLVGDVTPDHR